VTDARTIIAEILEAGTGKGLTWMADADAIIAALSAQGLVIVRTDFVNAAHEMVTNGDWCEQIWCIDRGVYDEAYNADLVRLHVDATDPGASI